MKKGRLEGTEEKIPKGGRKGRRRKATEEKTLRGGGKEGIRGGRKEKSLNTVGSVSEIRNQNGTRSSTDRSRDICSSRCIVPATYCCFLPKV